MATFKALNIESDDESDIEIDDTKEIQIEEALKLYQTALKYHSEGPRSYELAAEAYKTLFESEIFQYPESQSELSRLELYGPLPEQEESFQEDRHNAVLEIGSTGENAPSTLPQILHLSHKNYGDFMLEVLQAQLGQQDARVGKVTLPQAIIGATTALGHFVEALDKDDADIELWRRTSALGNIVGSRRIARFCLEAILDGDDDTLVSFMDLPGLAESLAGQQLSDLVHKLDDTLSLLQGPLSTMKRKQLSKTLKMRLESYPAFNQSRQSHQQALRLEETFTGQAPQRVVLGPPSNWADLADVLYRQTMSEISGSAPFKPGSAISFDLSQSAIPETQQQQQDHVPSSIELEAPIIQASPVEIEPQSPTLDRGQPTALVPAIQDSQELDKLLDNAIISIEDRDRQESISLPTRKRSSEAAGLADTTESVRLKSRRIRARGSLAESGVINENIAPRAAQQYANDLAQFQAVDDWCFDTVGGLLRMLGIPDFGISHDRRKELATLASGDDGIQSETSQDSDDKVACSDFYAFLSDFPEGMADFLMFAKHDTYSAFAPQPNSVTTAMNMDSAQKVSAESLPIVDATAGLNDFISDMSHQWLSVQDVAYAWVKLFVLPGAGYITPSLGPLVSAYVGSKWPESLKTMVVRIIVTLDDRLQQEMMEKIDSWKAEALQAELDSAIPSHDRQDLAFVEMIQTLFELHLDVYSLIKMPNSGVDTETIVTQRYRTDRWAGIAREAMRIRLDAELSLSLKDELNLRYIWSATFHIGVGDDISKDYVLDCLQQLRAVFTALDQPVIELQNNAVMPVLSVEAIDGEISRLTTSDFFARMFDDNEKDPVATIESLEPLLEYIHKETCLKEMSATEDDVALGHAASSENEQEVHEPNEEFNQTPNVSPELFSFLTSSKPAVRLALWQRLRDAYLSIGYMPMVANCSFRVIEALISEVGSSAYLDQARVERQTVLLSTLRQVQELLTSVLDLTKTHDDLFECMDDARLRSALRALRKLVKLMHTSNLFEDEIRVGQRLPPMLDNGVEVPSFKIATEMLHDLQVNAWTCLYMLFKEAVSQNKDSFITPDEDRMEFLRSLHRAIGIRGFCEASKRTLLNLIKREVVQLQHVEGYDLEFSQILFDIYGLRCFVNPSYEQLDHNCLPETILDRSTALQAVELLHGQAAKIKMSDLIKHPLKDAIDRVHGVVARKKPTDEVLRNREVYRLFFKSPIAYLDMIRCLRGESFLSVLRVTTDPQIGLAAKGWYFLMGNIALNKFRSQKRTAPGPTEDLEIAIAFFNQDLEYGADKWETWFRLAQAYDSKIEDNVTWSAEKLNTVMPEIAQYQRTAIHCYMMATGQAANISNAGFETSAKVATLYADFATRVYASSRQPFSMDAFSLHESEMRFISANSDIVRVKPFEKLTPFAAWRFAKTLFQRAIAGNPDKWTLHYMLCKCLWKMYNASAERSSEKDRLRRFAISEIKQAISLLPTERKDSKREAILEPHYKLVSMMHKCVVHGSIAPSTACKVLAESTHFARKVEPCQDFDMWDTYVLNVIKNLRAADKSNWHHRMISRAANVVYGDGKDLACAIGAKHELTQQMFTKTMTLQVWKPEFERPGRHFVYTTAYTRFFLQVLEQLDDRSSLEALARRTRKKAHDLQDHTTVWTELCSAYLNVLRRHGRVPTGHETAIFSTINHDEFVKRKDLLHEWCQRPESNSPVLEVLREVMELKKINAGLMKPGSIDDLFGDAYAYLYDTVGRQIWAEHLRRELEQKEIEDAKIAERQHLEAIAKTNTMMSLNHLMNLDGAASPLPTSITEPPQAPTSTGGDAAGQIDPAQIRRKTGVGRREIRTCAEACIAKSTNASSAQSMPEPPLDSRVRVVIPPRRGSSPPSSSRSLHDSADDESELSDVDEDIINDDVHIGAGLGDDLIRQQSHIDRELQRINRMFPKLRRKSSVGSQSGADGNADEEEGQDGDETREDDHGEMAMADDEDMELDEVEDDDEGTETRGSLSDHVVGGHEDTSLEGQVAKTRDSSASRDSKQETG